ncbi:MAG: nuclear transport factor 2 family protein [Gammaproteobacteria bacterium]
MKTHHAVMAASILVLSFALGNVVHTASSDATVEGRLRKLEDTEAIRSLLIAYGRALDSRDFKAYGQLFAKDGSWKGGMGSATSPASIQKMVQDGFGRMSPTLYENSNHAMTSMDIEVHGDTATAWSRWLWTVKGADGKPQVQRAGHYEDTLIRESGQWRFKTRQAFTEINP